MKNKYILVALVAANMIVATGFADTSQDERLVKNFAKINNYLEKNVASDDLEDNFEKVDQWKESMFAKFSGKSFKETQELFLSLPETIKNRTTCYNRSHRELLSRCDKGLADDAHLEVKNYPLRRIDRILEEVAYEHSRRCLFDRQRPKMRFAFKQVAYDRINSYLLDKVQTTDPEANMKAAEESFRGLDNKNGSYGQALKQFLSLKTILDESSCNGRGTEILLKNDLATTGEAYRRSKPSRRRVLTLTNHYYREHSKVCKSIYQHNCLARLYQLDVETYRRVLTLAAIPHLKVQSSNETEEYDNLVAEANDKQIDENFILPSVADSVRAPASLSPDQLVKFLKAATIQDPRSKFLEKVADERTGEQVLDREKVAELYDDYIHRPCENFYNLVEPDMAILDYHTRYPSNFRLIRSAIYACEDLTHIKEFYLGSLTDLLDPPQTGSHEETLFAEAD